MSQEDRESQHIGVHVRFRAILCAKIGRSSGLFLGDIAIDLQRRNPRAKTCPRSLKRQNRCGVYIQVTVW